MRFVTLALVALVMEVGCTQGQPPSATNASGARAYSSPTPASCQASTYGLLLSRERLEMVAPTGCVGASTRVAASSLHQCQPGGSPFLPPAVSATKTRVYFRDGDTKIRFLTPSGQTGDVTTVPGGPTVASSFAVSIDDQRIAVVVLDFSKPSIALQLYVEDLVGAGNHSVIFTNTLDAFTENGNNLWPVGWHAGNLVLAVALTCIFEPVPYPLAWHIVDAGTAVRKVSVGTDACLPARWPSPAGLACFEYSKARTNFYDWSGQLIATVGTPQGRIPALSRTPELFAMASGEARGDPGLTTTVYKAGVAPVTIPGAMACLWIDDTAMLAPNAVILYPSGTLVPEPQGVRCAGRFPGGL